MSKELELPVKEFGEFVDVAWKWLGTTREAKGSSLELRFANFENKLHLSVGGDSAYLECLLKTDASPIQQPFFLDLQYLMKLKFDMKTLALLIPPATASAKGEERRAQFRSPGLNFRIPLRAGDAWARNASDIGGISKEAPGIRVAAPFFTLIRGWLCLPDSFKANPDPCVTIESPAPKRLLAYEYDFGAYMNDFKHEETEHLGTFTRAVFRHKFFLPFEAIEDHAEKVEFQQTERQSFGKVQFKEDTQFFKFRWTEPNSTKIRDHIPSSIQDARKGVESCLVFDPKELLSNVSRVLMFSNDTQARGEAIQLSILKDLKQYNLDNRQNDSRILVDGEALEPASKTLRVLTQGKALKEYLQLLSLNAPIGFEVCPSSVIMYQQDPERGINLLYWAPINDR